ncbi:MAG: CBS and ACT domain-containing protein [Gemmatimonadota bacterium]
MTAEVVTVSPRTTVAAALEEIRSNHIRHLPVLDGGRLVGIVTDRDLRLALDPGGGGGTETQVDDVMTGSPIVADPDMPVESAAALLAEHRIGCLPVVEDGELVGILTESDLLRAFVDLMVGREPHTRIELLAPDRPGELARVVRLIGVDYGINITGMVVPPAREDRALVVLHLETEDVEALLANLRQLGYESASPALPSRPV